jgi:broad specificity phosphatase PhoE
VAVETLDRETRRKCREYRKGRRACGGPRRHRDLPPAGESWCDVILRLRSVLDTISLHYRGKRVLIVGHQVVVLCLRYLLENMDEQTILV